MECLSKQQYALPDWLDAGKALSVCSAKSLLRGCIQCYGTSDFKYSTGTFHQGDQRFVNLSNSLFKDDTFDNIQISTLMYID